MKHKIVEYSWISLILFGIAGLYYILWNDLIHAVILFGLSGISLMLFLLFNNKDLK